MTSVGSFLSLFHSNYKVKYNLCVVFIRCLDGALISLEVNTLNSSGSDPRKNVDRGNTRFLLLNTEKTLGVTVVFYRPS